MVIVPIIRLSVPLLVTLTTLDTLESPTSIEPKSIVVGLTSISGSIPVPCMVTYAEGSFGSFDGIYSCAPTTPATVGLNLTEILAETPVASD